jgi:hypothetical protein
VTHFSAKISIRFTPVQLLIAGLVLWCIFGDPEIPVANLFWKSGPAPWEQIDLLYYPDLKDPGNVKKFPNVSSLEECRTWARNQAGQHGDPRMERGGYTCSVGFTPLFGSDRVYRLALE